MRQDRFLCSDVLDDFDTSIFLIANLYLHGDLLYLMLAEAFSTKSKNALVAVQGFDIVYDEGQKQQGRYCLV